MKKLLISALLFGLVNISVWGQDLISNPGFENGMTDWASGFWGGAEASISASGDYAQEGSQSAKSVVTISTPDTPGKAYLRKNNLILFPGNIYQLSFHLLSTSGNTESIELALYSHTNIGGAAWGVAWDSAAVNFEGDGNWHRIDFEFIPSVKEGDPDFNNLGLMFGMGRNASTIYVDSVSLKPKYEIVIGGHVYHVSKNGDDTNDGSEVTPFYTLGKAAALAGPGDTVIIHEGTYRELLKPANSGIDGSPIVFQSFGGDRVVISAMEALSGWQVDAGNIYKTKVGWNMGQENFVLNGTIACDLARWPNNTDANPFTLNSLRNEGGSGEDVIYDAYLTDSEIPNLDWSQGGSLWFYGDRPGGGWTAWKAFIKNASSGRVEFDLDKNPSWIRTVHPPADKGDFYLEGIKDALDYDNEWFFDESDSTLYLQFPDAQAAEDSIVQMRKRKLTVDLNGRNYIEIKNLAILGGGLEISGSNNLIMGVSSFYGSMTRGVVSSFRSNQQSIYIRSGSNNRIERCEVAYGSGTGIWDAGNSSTIINCRVHDFDYLGFYDAPMNLRGRDASIQHNEVFRGGRDAIQITARNSDLSYNNVYKSNLIADDCGLLYTLGAGLFMDIHHNWFHDTRGRGSLYKAAGIYLDNDAADVNVYNNVVWNTEWSSIQINLDGTNINVYNNTLWDASGAMGAWHKDGTSFTNVNVWNNLTNMNSLEPQSDKQNNLVLESMANPFTNKEQYDFSLKEHSWAVDYGREISGYTEAYLGKAPDAGAYEGSALAWTAGISWDPAEGPAGIACYDIPGSPCGQLMDSDGDGVTDDLDLCPATPTGSTVNAQGCIIRSDADADGFHDGEDQCSDTPEGIAVDDYGCILDADVDGVPDRVDACLNTEAGIEVGEDGCPPDSDEDGVPDHEDACPDTPLGAAVDASGCPLDTDSDGIYDYLDLCPDTPAEAEVDADGCLLDEDADGVPDIYDLCPATPGIAEVDSEGCPLDTDQDGVPDYEDLCPATPAGTEVDAFGCGPDAIDAHLFEGISLFPNPAGSILHVRGFTLGESYKVCDHLGRTLLSGVLNESIVAISLDALEEGFYILKTGDHAPVSFLKYK